MPKENTPEGGYSVRKVLARSIAPSFRRALAAIWGVLAFPLFILATIMALSALDRFGILDLGPLTEQMIGRARQMLDWLINWLNLTINLNIPAIVFEIASIYFSIGNAVARSEKNELMGAYSFDRKQGFAEIYEGLKKARVDTWLPAIPGWLRGMFVRAGWPIIAAHRLHTPYIIEGPGPGDEDISSAVPSDDLASFTAMVDDAGKLDEQTFYDHRQVIAWQLIFGFGVAVLISLA